MRAVRDEQSRFFPTFLLVSGFRKAYDQASQDVGM